MHVQEMLAFGGVLWWSVELLLPPHQWQNTYGGSTLDMPMPFPQAAALTAHNTKQISSVASRCQCPLYCMIIGWR